MAERLPHARQRAPIRVLWLIDSLGTGGAEALTVRFVRGLRLRDPSFDRVRPTVAFLKRMRGNPYEEELRALGVEPEFLDARHLRDVRAFRRLLRLLRREPIDVIHAHLAYASIWGAVAGWWTGRPVVASLHVTPPRAPRWSREGLRRWLRARLLRRCGVVPVAVSRAVARSWSTGTSIPAHRIRVIPNGIEPVPRLSPARRRSVRRELGVGDEATVVMTVAVLRAAKGLDVLLAAAERVVEACPEVCFVAVGDGPEREALERRAAVPGLRDRVLFTGFRSDVAELLAAADVFTLPSREDAFPTVLLEAAAAGLPAVASDVGGMPEIVVSGKTGGLVPPEDPDALAEALIELVSQPQRRRRLGRAARRRAESELSADLWLDRLSALYDEVLDGESMPERSEPHRAPAAFASTAPRPTFTVIEPVGRGGLIHHAFQLCRSLAREGGEVTLITSRDYELGRTEGGRVPEAPFRVVPLLRLWDPKPRAPESPGRTSSPRHLRWLRRLRRLGRAVVWYREWVRLIHHLMRHRRGPRGPETPDVVLFGDLRFAGDLIPLTLLSWWCRRGPVLVDLCHNVRPFSLGGRAAGGFRRGGLSRALFHRIYRRFDRVVVHFESNRKRFLDTYPVAPERVGWIPLGNGELFRELADPQIDAALLRRRLQLPPDSPVVLLFGSLARYKGPRLLVEAFARIHRRLPETRLVLAGPPLPGLDPDELWREIESRGLGDAVRIEAGYVPVSEVAAWMQLATVAVFPYRDISQSAVVALALTFGVPVVVTRVGAMTEMVRDGETGRIVPPEDPRALARTVLELLEDPETARRLGRAAERFAHEELGWSRVARSLLAEVLPEERGTEQRDEGGKGPWRR